MKHSIFFLLAILTLSCTTDPRELLISEYEQVVDGVKTDLNLKVKEIKDLKPFYAKDSILFLQDSINRVVHQYVSRYNSIIIQRIESMTKMLPILDMPEVKKMYNDSEADNVKDENTIKDLKSGNYRSSLYLQSIDSRMKTLSQSPNEVLFNIIEVTYTIKNPLLNYAEQKMTKIYYISHDNTKILLSNLKK